MISIEEDKFILDVFGDAICPMCQRNIHWFTANEIIGRQYHCEDCANKYLRRKDEVQEGIT